MTDPIVEFNTRKVQFEQNENLLKSQANTWAWLRGIAFIAMLLFSYIFSKYWNNYVAAINFVLFFAGFLYSVSNHLSLLEAIEKVQFLQKINLLEITRLDNNFNGLATGESFKEKNHFFADDLDLFGQHSLFQLINRAHTFEGTKLLANWMKDFANKNEIIDRQNAAIELQNDIGFRQNLEMEAMLSDKISEPIDMLYDWLNQPKIEKVSKPFYKVIQYLPIFTGIVLLGAILGLYSFYFVALFYLIHGIILKTIDKETADTLKQTEIAAEILKPYVGLMQQIVDKPFICKKLKYLSEKIENAPIAVADLQKSLHQLSYRSNPAFAITGGILLLWDLRNLSKLEAWKMKHKNELSSWLQVVSEFEALNSLACFQFANPKYAIPKITDESQILRTEAMAHPLIHSKKRVENDFKLVNAGCCTILTGSNMSGKSTFERTIGLNLVLAQMGAVACAKYFECTEIQLFTSMRTQDSLENDTSSFYAELKRLEQLINFTKQPLAKLIFYLLDEVLKGTNSKDRHAGAKALILQLKNKNSAGIISTHDVELGDEFEGQPFIKNYSFSSEMADNELVFDYKLKEGVCHSFNASALMRKIGIELDPKEQ